MRHLLGCERAALVPASQCLGGRMRRPGPRDHAGLTPVMVPLPLVCSTCGNSSNCAQRCRARGTVRGPAGPRLPGSPPSLELNGDENQRPEHLGRTGLWVAEEPAGGDAPGWRSGWPWRFVTWAGGTGRAGPGGATNPARAEPRWRQGEGDGAHVPWWVAAGAHVKPSVGRPPCAPGPCANVWEGVWGARSSSGFWA